MLLAFGFNELRFAHCLGRRRRVGVDLALEREAVGQVIVSGEVAARQQRLERRARVYAVFADLECRKRSVGPLRHVAEPEVGVPPYEEPDALEAVGIGAPVLAGKFRIAPVDREALVAREY